jgi:Rad3-related DNA helicase
VENDIRPKIIKKVWMFCFESESNQNNFFIIGGRFMNRNGEEDPKEWNFQENFHDLDGGLVLIRKKKKIIFSNQEMKMFQQKDDETLQIQEICEKLKQETEEQKKFINNLREELEKKQKNRKDLERTNTLLFEILQISQEVNPSIQKLKLLPITSMSSNHKKEREDKKY